MKILIAMDSFKGSLGSREAGEIVKEGILEVLQDAEIIVKPLADGGEGTVEAIVGGLGGEFIDVDVRGPLGDRQRARYGLVENKAIMEMAESSGLTLVEETMRNPMNTTTYGLGEMILDGIERGYREFIIGLGGSATNDLGIGMLTSLGFVFLDKDKNPVGIYGRDLEKIAYIDDSKVDERIKDCRFQIACDVDNPLYGENGAAHIYGPQKGASHEDIEMLDNWARKFSQIVSKKYKSDYKSLEGVGAAGGLGYAFKSFLEGELSPGIEIISDFLDLDNEMESCDLAITGEGELDYQTMMGKAPSGIANIAKKHRIPVIAIAGSLGRDVGKLNELGIDAYFSITPRPMSLDQAMDRELARRNLKDLAKQIIRLYTIRK